MPPADAPAQAPVPTRFFCPVHGGTNHVIGLEGQPFCLTCVAELAAVNLMPAFKMDEIT